MGRPASQGWEKFPPLKTLDGLKWLCRWCRKELSGRQTSWCSRECQQEVQNRCNFSDARALVEKRDRGICAECGMDTIALRDGFKWYRAWHDSRDYHYRWPENSSCLARPHEVSEAMGFQGLIDRSLWECNHKVGISEGGALCDLRNLETLCIPCHAKHSAALMGRLAEKDKLVPDPPPPATPMVFPVDAEMRKRLVWHYFRSKMNIKQISIKFGMSYSRLVGMLDRDKFSIEWRDYQPTDEEITIMRSTNGA